MLNKLTLQDFNEQILRYKPININEKENLSYQHDKFFIDMEMYGKAIILNGTFPHPISEYLQIDQ